MAQEQTTSASQHIFHNLFAYLLKIQSMKITHWSSAFGLSQVMRKSEATVGWLNILPVW